MSDILHGFPQQPPPPLTAHLRHHLVAQMRADLTRAKHSRDALPRARNRRTEAQAARYWHLTDTIERTRADLQAMEAA